MLRKDADRLLDAVFRNVYLPLRSRLDKSAEYVTDITARLLSLEQRAPVPGPQGAPGERGAPGAQGGQGLPGPDGPPGAPGPQGERGLQGEPGLHGADGPIGAQGPPGAAGPVGADGERGAPGADGLTGQPGAQGPQGPQGADGPPGAQGMQGPPGAAGPVGADGERGAPGADGLPGPEGAQGPQGPEGPAGPEGERGAPGADGLSGPTGPEGKQGPEGPEGRQGPEGVGGLLPEVLAWTDKEYTRGACVTHRGGTWQAKCPTKEEPGKGGEWRCLSVGVAGIKVFSAPDNPRKFFMEFVLSDGNEVHRELDILIPVHKGKWDNTLMYEFNEECAWGGCSWRAVRNTATEPGKSEDWLLVSKQGKQGPQGLHGKDGQDGEKGERGVMGPPGIRGLTGERGAAGENGKDGADGAVGMIGRWCGEHKHQHYKKNDVVRHAGAVWMARCTTSTVPTAGDEWELVLRGS